MAHFHQRSGKPVREATGTLRVLQGGRTTDRLLPEASTKTADAHPGLYSWNINKNLLRGDAGVAELFDLDPIEVDRGLPVQAYLARVHSGDRARVVDALKQGLLTASGFNEQYRVVRRNGEVATVSNIAHLFLDETGEPVSWIGILHQALPSVGYDALQHCLIAYALAEASGEIQATEKLLDVLRVLRRST